MTIEFHWEDESYDDDDGYDQPLGEIPFLPPYDS